LARAATRRGMDLDIRAVGADDTGLPTGSVDAVVCTLVLCTVPAQLARGIHLDGLQRTAHDRRSTN